MTGAAAVVVMKRRKADELGLPVMAGIRAYSSAGVDPAIMGTGPIPATQRCLDKAGWSVDELDLVEANEAFAAQAISVNSELGWDPEKVNVNGRRHCAGTSHRSFGLPGFSHTSPCHAAPGRTQRDWPHCVSAAARESPWRWKDNLTVLTDMRIIKKYPNRRLYDTEISKYITLDDVRKLVLDGVEFRVTDVKTEEDLTRNVLLQIISEQEHEGKPIFNTPDADPAHPFLRQRLPVRIQRLFAEKAWKCLPAQQQSIQKNFQQAVSSNPFAATMSEITEQNMEAWRQLQDSLFQDDGLYRPGSGK